MNQTRKAFVLMPFKEPYNGYYPAIFRPALEDAGYDNVSRADDLFSPRPIMLDIQRSIVEADLILCEMSEKNPNVFYELGLAHAIGKPAILVSQQQEDIPFDLQHIRAIFYDSRNAGWEAQLQKDIAAAARSVDESEEIWPPPLIGHRDASLSIRGLSQEIAFNLQEIDRFVARGYKVVGNDVTAKGKSNVVLRYVTCMTSVFESTDVQGALALLDERTKVRIVDVYGGFREINDRADAIKKVFRAWRVSHYLEAIEEFQNNLRGTAEQVAQTTSRMGTNSA